MTPDEQAEFLRTAPKASLATVDQDGFPHVVAMGFLAKDDAIYMTSYGKAQKVINARRNPQVGLMIETGSHYAAYRGVMIRGHCEVIDDTNQVSDIIRESMGKNAGDTNQTRGEALDRAAKRVILKVTPEKIVSWDHSKLGGKY
jgi:PPOX class probable F420-dependent enzyme